HNVNRCGRSRHLARKLSLRRKRSSPNVFEMAATETITSIILIKLIRVSLGTVRHPRRFKIVVIDIQITLKQMLRDFIGIRVNRAKKSGMVNITSSVNYDQSDQQGSQDGKGHAAYARRQFEYKHYLISSKGAKPLEIKLLDTYLTKDDGFTAAFNTLQTMPTAKAKPRTVFYFKQFINSFA